jgi:CPA1 family monovalent cation:H+ antiporter
VKAPKSLIRVAEGESLLNDASSLIVFRFALVAVITGQFHLHEAAISFVIVVVMGILIGLVVGLIFYGFHRWLPTTPSIEIVLTILTPYCMYYFAEHFHFSGVLAVVSGGLFLSGKRQIMLNYQSRLQGFNVWAILGFVLNGLVFILIGLQLPSIVNQLGDISLIRAIGYGLLISFILIVTRMICTMGASLFTRFMSHFIKVADSNPGWRGPLVLGWAGMRGVVSLAAALSIPLLISEGHPFPYRNLILFITFIVILVTLVFQGLTLPWVIKMAKPENRYNPISEQHQEIIIQRKIAQHSIQFIEEKYSEEKLANDHLRILHEKLKNDLSFFNQEFEEITSMEGNSLKDYQNVYLELLQHQRALLNKMNNSVDCNEELIRKYFGLIDLEEFKIRERLPKEDGDLS